MELIMAVWLIRAGKNGQREQLALEKNVSVVDWGEMPDLSNITTKEQMESLFKKQSPGSPQSRVSNYVGQLWAFRDRIKQGDLVALPLKGSPAIAIGKITGDYKYRPDLPEDARHTRPTQWLRTDIPRGAFDQDLLYSLGAFMTVCQITRNDAEKRINAILLGKTQPGGGGLQPAAGEALDIESYAQDQLNEHISRKYRGHDLSQLVNEILRAQGYKTMLSPPGSDGGADILAGGGPMGFDRPRLCVQVKSQETPVDVAVLRDLQGTLKNFGAEQGLLVPLGGFKGTVTAEARRSYFEIRLWDASDILRNLLEVYEKLPEQVRAELPLKRVWALVPEETE